MFKLDNLLGNLQTQELLQKILINPPQTLLFEGPKGVGKKKYAKSFAKALLKSKKKDPPDLQEFFPEGKAYLHPINTIREFIRETEILPFESPYKVFLIHEVDRMLPTSMNALLKILEEPPSHCVIILITSVYQSLLPTITSRTFNVPFSLLTEEEIMTYLEGKKTDEEARKIAFLSNGSFEKLQEILNGEKTVAEDIFNLGVALIQNKYPFSKDYGVTKGGEEVLLHLFYFFRDLHLLKIGANPSYLFYHEKVEKLKSIIEYPIKDLEVISENIEKMYCADKLHIPLSHSLCSLF